MLFLGDPVTAMGVIGTVLALTGGLCYGVATIRLKQRAASAKAKGMAEVAIAPAADATATCCMIM